MPVVPGLSAAWPTPNRLLFTEPERYFARTRANPDYGRPGWTRECGERFHKGLDIAPVEVEATGESATVLFTDCATGKEYESTEPVLVPSDPVYAILDGTVDEACTDAQASDYGLHVVLAHDGPGDRFYSLYAHLAEVSVRREERVARGQKIGVMGQTSRIADARVWMKIAPHLHIEIWNARRKPCDPEAFLRKHLERGGF